MHAGKLVFAQLMEHLPLHTFRQCVAKYPSRYPTLKFSHLDQFLCTAFAQLTYRESLRDIETCLRAHQAKLYHLGIRGNIAKSTLADANKKRDCRIYADFAISLIQVARKIYASDRFAVELAGADGLCTRHHDHRLVFEPLSMGTFSPSKSCRQDAYATRPVRQHSNLHSHHRWQDARGQCARHLDTRSLSSPACL